MFLSACIYNIPFHQGALNIIMCSSFFFKFQSVSILTIHYNRYGRKQFQIMPFSNIFKKPKLDHYKLSELINLLMQVAWNSPFDKPLDWQIPHMEMWIQCLSTSRSYCYVTLWRSVNCCLITIFEITRLAFLLST